MPVPLQFWRRLLRFLCWIAITRDRRIKRSKLSTSCEKLSPIYFVSGNCLAYFEKKYMAYQVIKKKPPTATTNKQWNTVTILVNKNLSTVPVQLCPSPIYPGLHVQTYDPYVLLHAAFMWHLWVVLHSSVSVIQLERKRGKRLKIYQLNT